ncbi:Predicted thiol-disulfide oxidoreductase YuxK, DCC family [Marinospirillum celere]|uniref:Predicted thiol-disulfide oxidoreductase YuxK, DCC family n=1 Tax=Marinospirillum celere TaxID=1122252 RepID=A0A1I1DYX3_9GAMM|nr:DUF393 domain-containing protein [Marinospirillum celere]SFB79626.1 Predicted thiol-disulfide oxidoreductase YuxK, DCC family [Marinospirillum celere]
MTDLQPRLYYDASCGFCRKEIDHLRPKLEPDVKLIDISASQFQPPEGYSLDDLMTRIHYFDGQQMQVGFAATLSYWRQAGLIKTARLLSLPGIFHSGNFVYNCWAKWRRKHSSQCRLP